MKFDPMVESRSDAPRPCVQALVHRAQRTRGLGELLGRGAIHEVEARFLAFG
jgi:hypothetical protein